MLLYKINCNIQCLAAPFVVEVRSCIDWLTRNHHAGQLTAGLARLYWRRRGRHAIQHTKPHRGKPAMFIGLVQSIHHIHSFQVTMCSFMASCLLQEGEPSYDLYVKEREQLLSSLKKRSQSLYKALNTLAEKKAAPLCARAGHLRRLLYTVSRRQNVSDEVTPRSLNDYLRMSVDAAGYSTLAFGVADAIRFPARQLSESPP